MADYVPHEFFDEEAPNAPDSSGTQQPPPSPPPKSKGKFSMTKLFLISMLIMVVVFVVYIIIKRSRGGGLDSPSPDAEAPMSTEHDNIVANTSKAELAALLNNDFKQADILEPVATAAKGAVNQLRESYLKRYAAIEQVTNAFMSSLPPHLANSIISAKKMFESVKLDKNLIPTDTDSFMTFYGLDIANKIMGQQSATAKEVKPTEEQNAAPPTPPLQPPTPEPILKKDDPSKDNIRQSGVSFVEEISSNDDGIDSKKIISQLNNDSDDDEEE